mmetsp:Transcript_30606/g.101330  ORF Transcript_30606/g.101330 Transcript_30606/m.101330 type:complete len:241 (-) Transcript_30606:675-1397(-)
MVHAVLVPASLQEDALHSHPAGPVLAVLLVGDDLPVGDAEVDLQHDLVRGDARGGPLLLLPVRDRLVREVHLIVGELLVHQLGGTPSTAAPRLELFLLLCGVSLRLHRVRAGRVAELNPLHPLADLLHRRLDRVLVYQLEAAVLAEEQREGGPQVEPVALELTVVHPDPPRAVSGRRGFEVPIDLLRAALVRHHLLWAQAHQVDRVGELERGGGQRVETREGLRAAESDESGVERREECR